MSDIPLPNLDGDDPVSQIDEWADELTDWLADMVARDTATLTKLKEKVQLGTHAGLAGALLTAVATTNGIEWGHHETAGFRCTLGAESGTGKPFIGFNCEHGTNSSTYRTRGKIGIVIRSELDGTLTLGRVPLVNADNQTLTDTIPLFPTAWTALGAGINTGSGWAASTAVPQYRKVGDSVQLRGRVSSPVAGSNSTVGTLPAGYRPGVAVEFYGRIGSAAEAGAISISTAGVITRGGTSNDGGVVLDGISFSTLA